MNPSSQLIESFVPPLDETNCWNISPPSSCWRQGRVEIWSTFTYEPPPRFGWKIHVSSTLAEAPNVLNVVSQIAFECRCSFKYLFGVDAFLKLHFKNASRLQSGKFVALYPSTEAVAAEILEKLYQGLRTYRGLDILTDRQYKDSASVYYRWGAFSSTGRLNNKGEAEELVPNGLGQLVPDTRLPRFTLPEAMVDPFSTVPYVSANSSPASVCIDQFVIESVLRFTNAGGRYKAKCTLTGADVVIKEARPDTGFVGLESAIPRLRREVAVLNGINRVAESLAPSILKHFAIQDHEYVALAYLPGVPLSEWIARENPLYSSLYSSCEHVCKYFARASRILDGIRSELRRLHQLGLAFGDLSLGNVIVNDDDFPRFIDFEACTAVDDAIPGLRTPDFCLLHEEGKVSARERDLYALDCIAVALVLRLTTLAEISQHVFTAITADLAASSNAPPQWWFEACDRLSRSAIERSVYRAPNFSPPSLDTPASRGRLRQLIAQAAIDCYNPHDPFLFPTSAVARKGAFLSFGFGAAGLLWGLKASGIAVDPAIVSRFTKSVDHALDCELLPMNYDVGTVGLLDTSVALGLRDIAERIFDGVLHGWEGVRDPSLGRGLTGVALTLRRNGYGEIAEEVMARAIRLAKRYPWEKNGLLYGRSGTIAGACQFHSLLKSRAELRGIVRDLISEEFRQTVRHPRGDSLSLRAEVDGSRVLPYLADGTAGFLLALLHADASEYIDFSIKTDDVLALSADLETPFMLEGSLMDGAAGLAVALEVTRQSLPALTHDISDPGWRRIRKYLLPLESGVGVLHPGSLKFDLGYSQGSMGISQALLWLDAGTNLNLCGLFLAPRA